MGSNSFPSSAVNLGAQLGPMSITKLSPKGPSIKYVTLFLANFDPLLPLSHFVTHPGTPRKYVTHLGPSFRFLVGLVQQSWTKVLCTNSISIVRGGFCPGWFLSIPPSVTIHLLQQKVKHHFKFHVSYV